MKTLIIIGVILLIIVSVWYAKKTGANSEYYPTQKTAIASDTIDNPVGFGYKMIWIAVKTNQKNRLAEIIKLEQIQNSNWESGITAAYKESIFITPQIGEWTLITGNGLVKISDDPENLTEYETLLNTLSTEFGEAQFFGTHRVVEYHCWMKSKAGKMERIYAYIGESMENIKVYGLPTEAEEGLNLFNSLSDEAKNEAYFEQDDLIYADEELVMKIANAWSANPTTLAERTDIKAELGLIGK